MTERYLEFSAAKDASQKDPVIVNIDGEEFEFPAFLSASVVLSQLSYINQDGSLAASKLKDWFSQVFGEENLEKISKKVDFKTLQEISTKLLGIYGLEDQPLPTEVSEEDGDNPK